MDLHVGGPITRSFGWVDIPAGRVWIGTDAPAGPGSHVAGSGRKAIHLPAFAIGRTPVTNRQYAVFVRATGHRAPAHWEGSSPPDALADHPVTYVDWHDTRAFCAWAGARLPTEAEWEKAARGTDGRA